ncbi:Fact complex subunit ssrp1, partial [Globisporangium splendens]
MAGDATTDAASAVWGQCDVTYGEQPGMHGENNAPQARRPVRSWTRRYSPYCANGSSYKPNWSTRIQEAVHNALQESDHHRYDAQSCRHVHDPQSEAPVMRARRVLATKLQLAAQSVVNMAAYVEWQRSVTRQTSYSNDEGGQRRVDTTEITICCICLETNDPDDSETPIETLCCGHAFHRACIHQWSRQRRCCPVDRLPIVEMFDDDEDNNATSI